MFLGFASPCAQRRGPTAGRLAIPHLADYLPARVGRHRGRAQVAGQQAVHVVTQACPHAQGYSLPPTATNASSDIGEAYAAATSLRVRGQYPWLHAGAPWIVYNAATSFYAMGISRSEALAVVIVERGIFCAEAQ